MATIQANIQALMFSGGNIYQEASQCTLYMKKHHLMISSAERETEREEKKRKKNATILLISNT